MSMSSLVWFLLPPKYFVRTCCSYIFGVGEHLELALNGVQLALDDSRVNWGQKVPFLIHNFQAQSTSSHYLMGFNFWRVLGFFPCFNLISLVQIPQGGAAFQAILDTKRLVCFADKRKSSWISTELMALKDPIGSQAIQGSLSYGIFLRSNPKQVLSSYPCDQGQVGKPINCFKS